jgi:hypothetical protein
MPSTKTTHEVPHKHSSIFLLHSNSKGDSCIKLTLRKMERLRILQNGVVSDTHHIPHSNGKKYFIYK